MDNFGFVDYGFKAPAVSQQQNDRALQEFHDTSSAVDMGTVQADFNFDDYFGLSEEEQNRIIREIINEQRSPLGPPNSSTQADDDLWTTLNPAIFGPTYGHQQAIDGDAANGARENAVHLLQQGVDTAGPVMSNSTIMHNPMDPPAFDGGLTTDSQGAQSLAVRHQDMSQPSRFQLFNAEESQNQVLSGKRITIESSASRQESIAQLPASANRLPGRGSGYKTLSASRVKGATAPKVRRRRVSTSEFWETHTTIAHPTLRIKCRGTFHELLERHPELESTIKKRFIKWKNEVSGRRGKAAATRKQSARAPAPNAFSGARPQSVLFPTHLPPMTMAQSPSTLNMSELHVQSPAMFSLYVSPATIAPQVVMKVHGTANFDLEHQSIEGAHEYLEVPPQEVCEQLNIEGDDWEPFSEFRIEFQALCQQLFEALQHPGGEVPEYFDQEQSQSYAKNHANAYNLVQDLMRTAEQVTEAKARVIKAMNEVVRVHEVGVPMTVVQMKKKARGYDTDTESICSQRAQKVIDNTRACKYIALDILKSKNLADFARSPDQYLMRKYGNSKGNKNRGDELKEMQALKKGQKTADEVLGGGLLQHRPAISQMATAAPTPSPDAIPQQQSQFGSATVSPESSMYFTPPSHGIETPGHQEGFLPASYPLPTEVTRGSKRGRVDGENEDLLQDVERFGRARGSRVADGRTEEPRGSAPPPGCSYGGAQ